MRWDPYRALYLHIPFCKARCAYCDFATQAIAATDSCLDEYTEWMISRIRAASREDLLGSVQTVYIGGGTPSYLGNKRLSSLMYALGISMHLTPEVECTLEANPESLTLPMVRDLFALGVTRISLGVQTFNDELLKALGRIHSADDARRAIAYAQDRFENVSIDLMCGLPGQTPDAFERDLHEAISLGVTHMSVYPLSVEDNTPLSYAVRRGQVVVDEDVAASCMQLASLVLEEAKMRRYEVASYAYPGFESRHNQAYWTGKPYLGIGQGAVGMRQNATRRQRFEGDRGQAVIEELNAAQMAAEDLMLGMRRAVGVADEKISTMVNLLPGAIACLRQLEADGYIEHTQGSWRPTHKGWLFGNVVYGRLLELAP